MAKHEGMKALGFQEPCASQIVTGAKTVECRSRKINVPVKDLVVCASKTPSHFKAVPGLAYGYAIGLIDVVSCERFRRRDLDAAMMDCMPGYEDMAWRLENPRLIKPFPVHATASFFYVQNEIQLIPSTLDAYMEEIFPICREFDSEDAAKNAAQLFANPDTLLRMMNRKYGR